MFHPRGCEIMLRNRVIIANGRGKSSSRYTGTDSGATMIIAETISLTHATGDRKNNRLLRNRPGYFLCIEDDVFFL